MPTIRTLPLASLCLAIFAASPDPNTASIQGLAVTIDGKVISNAVIFYNPTPPIIPARLTMTSRTTSNADGSFSIQSLAAGAYALCIRVADAGFVDACQWDAVPRTVTLAAGQATTGVRMTAQKACQLQVRVKETQLCLD